MAEMRMPKMGDGMEEGTINTWLKNEGDMVQAGEPIAEIETDKANVEISAYETGILTKILVQVGQTVPVGEIIAQIGAETASSAASAPQKIETVAAATPAAASRSENNGYAPVERERVKASPLARRMMAASNLDAAQLHGTGPGGRIVERDVQAFLANQEKPAPALAVELTSPQPVAASAETVKPSRMREAIARRTTQSKQQIPHFYVTMAVEMDRAQALLKELNADNPDGKVTVNDLIVKSCAIALQRVPAVNATWTSENTVKLFAEAHIGVAVGIEEGLIIPVVKNCQAKTLRAISAETKSLIKKARTGQLKPEEYSGGTFSISNLGMMGVDEFTAIINPPEAAILAIGGIFREFVPGENDAITVRSRMKVTLSADHRLLDGVVAAQFLQEVKKTLEAPFSLLS